MSEKHQRLAVSIIEFLKQSTADGTVKADDADSIDVAIQCIGECFNVDPSDQEQIKKLSIKPASLLSVFDVYLKTMNKVGSGSTASSSTSPPPQINHAGPSPEDKVKAEQFKATGNAQMTTKKYDDAIASYSKAIELDPKNPIYYSNRAAAYSSQGDHISAVGDAEEAIKVDATYVKSYHRLGHAQYALADFEAAADAFERGLQIDPSNASLKAALASAQTRITETSTDSLDTTAAQSTPQMPAGLGGMADLLRGMGGAGGAGGGMPDLASMMNNPQLMAMAQQLASNGGLANMMQNPAVANMMNRVQQGNMPSMDELFADPTMKNLAEQFGGMGRQ